MDKYVPSLGSVEDFPPLEQHKKNPMRIPIQTVGEKRRCQVCKWLSCCCQTSEESFSFLQRSEIDDTSQLVIVKGGAREKKEKKIKIPKLRVVDSEQYDSLANHLRVFSKYWHHYDSHAVCPYDKKCAFCLSRSISMRLNGPKREPSIKPRELESLHLDSLSLVFPAMAEACQEFETDSVLKVYCENCKYTVPVGQSTIMTSIYDHKHASVEASVNFLIRKEMKFTRNCCESVREKFKIMENQRFLCVAFEQPISNIGSTTFKVQNAEFEILSVSYEGKESKPDKKKVAFRHEEVFLSQLNKEISLENLSIDSGKVSFVILGRTGQKGTCKVKPYDKTALYEKSTEGKMKRKLYEASKEGKET